MLVKESLDQFKRNQDVKSVLKLGSYRKIINPTEEDWLSLPSGSFLMQSYDDYYNVAIWNKEKKYWLLRSWKETKKEALDPGEPFCEPIWIPLIYKSSEEYISFISMQRVDAAGEGKFKLHESISFQRGQDPKETLGIGEHNPKRIAEIREKLFSTWLAAPMGNAFALEFPPNKLHPLEQWLYDNYDIIGKRYRLKGEVAIIDGDWMEDPDEIENYRMYLKKGEVGNIDMIVLGIKYGKIMLYIRDGMKEWYVQPDVIEKYFEIF